MTAKRRSISTTALRLLLGAVVLAATLWGAGFWDKKDFRQWNEREVARVFTNSPWAKSVSITMGMAPGAFSGGGGGGGRRGGGGGGTPQSTPSLNLTIRFNSALPVKHALVKFNMGESTELTPQMQEFLDRPEDYYVVAVENLPAMLARFEEAPERLIGSARLRRKGKEDLTPATVEVKLNQTSRRVEFTYFFVKTDPIELADKDVEFYMKLERPQGEGRRAGSQRRGGPGAGQGGGQRQRGGQGGGGQRMGAGQGGPAMALFGKEIRRKFRLKDMVYSGELAL